MNDLSVVIVTYNAAAFLPACLSSIARHLSSIAYEVCVVDNASGDGTRALIEKQFPWVVLVANERNVGFAAGVNCGLERGAGRYVLWLNPDAELLDDGFVEIIRYLDAHPEVAVVGPQLVNPRGEIELSCRSFPSYGAAIGHRYSLLTRVFPQNRYTRQYLRTDLDHSSVEDVDWVSGACLLQRRDVVYKVGLLDERFFMYCEDVDFCLRVHRQGLKVRYHPGARVLHHIGGSSRQVSRQMIVEHHRSMWRYYAKHLRRNVLKDAVVATAIWTRCAVKAVGATRVAPRERRETDGTSPAAKRVLDIGLSGFGLLVSSPLWLLIALAIKLEDGGPVFYAQDRVGLRGRTFKTLKFRSMIPDAEHGIGAIQAREADTRVTYVGRFLRVMAMDELPQLWNICRGDMSFVGPRALRPGEIEVAGDGRLVPLAALPGYVERCSVRPGLTGIAQIYAPRNIPRRQKFRYDRLYLRRQGFWLDVRLILLSFWISMRGTWEVSSRKY